MRYIRKINTEAMLTQDGSTHTAISEIKCFMTKTAPYLGFSSLDIISRLL